MISKSYIIEKNINLIDNNLVLFYGENLGLKNFFKDNIKNQKKNFKAIFYSQDEIIKDPEILYNEIFNFSLFQEEKKIFINDVNDKILSLISEIEEKDLAQKIYLFAGILDKKSKLRNYFEKSKKFLIVPCYSDNELTMKNIIIERLKGFKGLTTQNVNMIVESCNLDRDKLKNEINKIIVYFEDKNIKNHELENLLNSKENIDFSILKDGVLNGDKLNTNKLISDTIIEPEKNILYLSMINQRLLGLLKIKENNNDLNIERKVDNLKPPIFWKDKPIFLIQAKKWNIDKIKEALNKTYKLELKIKTNSSLNHVTLLKKLLVDICNLANA